MANRRILQYPNPRLRRVSTDIDFNSEDPTQIVQDLLDTLDVSSGVGLAAPQIGYEKNIVILQPKAFGVDNPDPFPQREQFMVFINPEMILSENKVSWPEACLSVPLGQGNVSRSETCEVKYRDISGNEKLLSLKWPLSAALQHECDHLEGKLFIDRVSRFVRESITKKITKLNKKKAREAEQKKEEEIFDLYGEAGLRDYRKRKLASKGNAKKKIPRKKKPKTFGRKKKKK